MCLLLMLVQYPPSGYPPGMSPTLPPYPPGPYSPGYSPSVPPYPSESGNTTATEGQCAAA